MGRARLGIAVLVSLLAALGLVASLTATPAGAQDDDPYGNTTTTAPPGQTPSCQLRTEAGAVGSRASVTVKSVPRDATVRLLFDGRQVATAQATGPGNSARTNVDIDFTVPEAQPGMHQVTAVGADFTASCRTSHGDGFEVVADGEVLGAQVTRDGSGGSLPGTGITVGILLAVAAGLLLLGRALLTGSKRRTRGSAGSRARTGV